MSALTYIALLLRSLETKPPSYLALLPVAPAGRLPPALPPGFIAPMIRSRLSDSESGNSAPFCESACRKAGGSGNSSAKWIMNSAKVRSLRPKWLSSSVQTLLTRDSRWSSSILLLEGIVVLLAAGRPALLALFNWKFDKSYLYQRKVQHNTAVWPTVCARQQVACCVPRSPLG